MVPARFAGVIQLRAGNTAGGMLFCGFAAFWLSLFAIAQFFLKAVPLTQVGHALGLYLFAFGAFVAWLFAASFRTSIAVVVALLLLTVTLFVLAVGLRVAGLAGAAQPGGRRGACPGWRRIVRRGCLPRRARPGRSAPGTGRLAMT